MRKQPDSPATYAAQFSAAMMRLWGITLEDTGLDGAALARFASWGQSPEQAAEAYGDKHGLIPVCNPWPFV